MANMALAARRPRLAAKGNENRLRRLCAAQHPSDADATKGRSGFRRVILKEITLQNFINVTQHEAEQS